YYIEKFLARYTDVLITINKEDYDVAKKFYTKEKCLLNGIGVDTSRFVHKPKSDYLFQELNINKEETVLLSVGELIKRKNHETMIRAIEEIKRPDIHYVIAGDGELEDYYRDLIIQLGLNNVHLLGYRTDVNELCNAADIFVIPSYQEGLSVALMEAMACGLPVIASRIRGNVDLIQNDVGGILVGVDELSEYKEAIIKLANNKKLRKNMGYSNIDRVKQFDILSVEKQLLSVFESL
ncbi:MAG: glycosyltransferase family 4 protein, partial [Hungatella sp.]|nr:glycosyltransferase family 4 protein [Hungatella sp.]